MRRPTPRRIRARSSAACPSLSHDPWSAHRCERQAELVEAGRALEVLEPVQAEVAERLAVEENRRRGREDGPASVGERSHTRSPMHVEADVALGAEQRSSGVQAHADADRPARERLAACPRSVSRAPSGREGDEERVALGVDLDAAVGRERGAQRSPVLGERLAVRVRAEVPEQACRALDVGEEERGRAGWEIGASSLSVRHQPVLRGVPTMT